MLTGGRAGTADYPTRAMSSHASALRREGPGDRRADLVDLAVAVWSVAVVAGALGLAGVPHWRLLAVALPAALVAAGALGNVEPSGRERFAALWAIVLGGGILSATVVLHNPEWAVAIPAIAVAAVAAARWPAAAVIGLFVLAGFYESILALTPVQPYKIADVLLGGFAAGVLWRLMVRGEERRALVLWPGVAALLAYAVITAFQIPLASTVKIGRDSFHASTWYLLALVLVAVTPWRAAQRERAVRGVVVVALLVGGYAVFRWIAGPASAERQAVLATRAAFNFVNGKLVLFGSFPTGHHLAAWTAVIVPFCFAVGLAMRSWRWRLTAATACGLCTAALVGSKVRAGFAALALGLLAVVVIAVLSRGFAPIRPRALAAGGIALVAVIITFVALASGPEGARYANILDPGADQAFQERTYKWHDALSDVDKHPWGQGLGTAGISQVEFGRFISLGKTDVDNSYLKIALDQGIGLVLLYAAGLLLLLGGLARRAIAAATPEAAALAAGSAGALVAFVVMIATGVYIEGLTAVASWIVIGLGVARFSRA